MASLERDKAVYQTFGSTFSSEFCGGDSEHVPPPARAVRKEEDIRISSSCDWQGPKVVNDDGYSGAAEQGDGECRPANSLAKYLSDLALEAASYPYLVQACIPTNQ